MYRVIPNRWYDSVLHLDGDDPSLELRVRTYLHPYAPRGGHETHTYLDGEGEEHSIDVVNWDESWPQWRLDVERLTERGWSRSLWLVPHHGPIQHPTDSARAFPNLRCRLNLHLVDRSQNPHLVVTCRKLDGNFFRSSMGGPTTSRVRPHWDRLARGIREQLSGSYEPNHGDLDDHDTQPKSSGQIPLVHEFGHYLGLSHVACMRNDSECYGQPGTWAYDDIMGGGTRIEAWHGTPWLRRLGRHIPRLSRFASWDVVTSRPPPQRPPRGGFRSPRRMRDVPEGGVGGLDGGV